MTKSRKYLNYRIISAFFVVLAIAFLGSHFLFQSHAAATTQFGIYQDGDTVSNVTSFTNTTGVKPTIMEVYSDGDSLSSIANTTYSYTGAAGTSTRLLIGTSICGGSVSSPGGTLAAGAAGSYNSTWSSMAKNLVNEGLSNSIIRVGFELYGNWFPCSIANSTDATNYAAYFRQIVNTMRAVPGQAFQFDWEMAVPGNSSYTAAEAWPGSGYVDYIGYDTYDETWSGSCGLAFNSSNATAAQSNCAWNNTILPALTQMTNFAAANGNLPVVFPEWGLSIRSDGHGLGDDPTFIQNMHNWISSNNVGFDIYFNSDSGGQIDMITDGNFPNSLAAFKTIFASSTTTTPPTTPTPPPTPAPTAPAAVTNLTTTVSGSNVTLNWTNPSGAQGDDIFKDGTQLTSLKTVSTTYQDTNLAAGTYTYSVAAYNATGVGTHSNTVTVTIAPAPTAPPAPVLPPAPTPLPSTPTGLTATANNVPSVSLSWNASTDSGGPGLAGYYIIKNGVTVGSVNASTTKYTDKSVSASTTYKYTVEAYDSSATPNVSAPATISIITPAIPLTAAPTAPSGLTATVVSSSQINLSWNASTDPDGPGLAGYYVYENGSKANSSPLTSTTAADSSLNPSTSYSFYIVAVNTNGLASVASNTVSATTQAKASSYPTGPITGLAGKCLDNYYSKKVNYNKIDLYDCNGTGAQSWTYNPNSGTIVNSNGYCLDVLGDGQTSGTIVDLYQCNGTAAQVWAVNTSAHTISSPQSGLCLDDKFSSTTNGNQIWVYNCNGTGAQKWTLK